MNTLFDKELMKIKFYQTHESYLPFIGDRYDRYRILQVGESHYIDKNDYGIHCDKQDFYDSWWNSKVLKNLEGNIRIHTRDIIDRYIRNGDNPEKIPYKMYGNTLKVFEEVFGLADNRENYNCFAFMNFFQMPSFVYGESIYSSLEICGDSRNIDIGKIWNEVCNQSSNVFSNVVDIIRPKLIIFTSKLAYDICKERVELENNVRIEHLVHPDCPWWNRSEGKYGREKFRKILKEFK